MNTEHDLASTPIEEQASDMETPLLEVSELETYYESRGPFSGPPVKAVDGVSFTIDRGETLGLVGESGCGKTTLGRTLVHLESATAGSIRFDGEDVTTLSGGDLRNWRERIGFVFQDPDSSLNDRRTVGESIREPLDVHNWKTRDERKARVRELLDVVGLNEEHYYRYPHQFSGGQKQRIGIARALALEPDFVVLDEPVSALDVSVQAKVLNLLADLQEEFDLTYLFIAHDLSVVRHVCDRVAVMYLGNIMELGETEDLFASPGNPYTRALLSAIPIPDPTKEVDRTTLTGTPPSPRHPPDGCPFSARCPVAIRPEEFRDVSDEIWELVTAFWGVVRQRSRSSKSLSELVRERLGLQTRFSDMSEVVDELFVDVAPPDRVEAVITETARRIEADSPEAGLALLEEEFGSVCIEESPDDHVVSETGRLSHCHRHREAYRSPGEKNG